jgi:cysteine synthase A
MRAQPGLLDLIGSTPLLHLSRLAPSSVILAKLESRNPSGSIKDRVAKFILEEAFAQGRLRPGDTIVEATAGNLGLSLALVGAVKGLRTIIVMPEGANPSLRVLLLYLGAEVVLTPAAEGMAGAGRVAGDILDQNPGYFGVKAFENPLNPRAHHSTARELLRATRGSIDAFVAGIGTGGTITGVGQVLKREVKEVRIVGVEPARSPLLSQGRAGPHGIPGLGASFVPPILDRDILDEVIAVGDEDALEMASSLARKEGLLVGLSSGANVFAALQVAQRLGPKKRVATVLPDSGEKYVALGERGEAARRRK